MEQVPRQQYTREFREQVVRLVLENVWREVAIQAAHVRNHQTYAP